MPASSAAFRWLAPLAALAAALLLAACGGSGSSGFDIVALENQAIDRAIETSMCQDVEGLTICAAGEGEPSPTATEPPRATMTPTAALTATAVGTTTPTGTPTGPDATASPSHMATATTTPERPDTPTATPTPTAMPTVPNVGTNLGDSSAVPCQPAAEGCVLDFEFRPENIDPSATFWIAVRRVDPAGAWRIFPNPIATGSMDAPMFEQGVEVDFSDDEVKYQIAVLVFYASPGDAPDEVERLGDTGADLAFVTTELTAVEF